MNILKLTIISALCILGLGSSPIFAADAKKDSERIQEQRTADAVKSAADKKIQALLAQPQSQPKSIEGRAIADALETEPDDSMQSTFLSQSMSKEAALKDSADALEAEPDNVQGVPLAQMLQPNAQADMAHQKINALPAQPLDQQAKNKSMLEKIRRVIIMQPTSDIADWCLPPMVAMVVLAWAKYVLVLSVLFPP